MSKKKILGYIVCSQYGVKQLFEGNILWLGSSATLFKTRAKALSAVKRSVNYAISQNYDTASPWFNNELMPVKGEK
jgi:hypothetical protein